MRAKWFTKKCQSWSWLVRVQEKILVNGLLWSFKIVPYPLFDSPSLVCQVTAGLQWLHWPTLTRALTWASYVRPGTNNCFSSFTLVFVTSSICEREPEEKMFKSRSKKYLEEFFVFELISFYWSAGGGTLGCKMETVSSRVYGLSCWFQLFFLLIMIFFL